jgi:hypothetical protein
MRPQCGAAGDTVIRCRTDNAKLSCTDLQSGGLVTWGNNCALARVTMPPLCIIDWNVVRKRLWGEVD